MSREPKAAQKRIDQFFSGPGARADDWRDLVEAAKTWARVGNRAAFDAALAELSVTEEYHAVERPIQSQGVGCQQPHSAVPGHADVAWQLLARQANRAS